MEASRFTGTPVIEAQVDIAASRLLRSRMSMEWLSVIPTRFFTGNFAAAPAVKKQESIRSCVPIYQSRSHWTTPDW